MITIKDIAKEAGVSHGTVSNVINKTGKVSTEKIKLVEAAVKKLGYVRNTQAQQLRQGFKKLIAVIIPSLQIYHYAELFSVLRDQLINHEYEVELYITNDVPVLEKNILENINFSRLAAIVTVSSLTDAISIYNNNFPVIFIDRIPKHNNLRSTYISFDFKSAGLDIGKYIIDNGYKNIAYFSCSHNFTNEKSIFDGLSNLLLNNDVSIQRLSSDYKLATTKSFDLFMDDQSFDVIVTTDIERAEAVLSASKFSSYDNLPCIITIDSLRTFSTSHFVSYELNYKLMGRTIADTLIDHLVNNNPLKKNIILKNDGFRFTFTDLNHSKQPTTLNMLTLISPSSIALQKILPNFKKATGIDVKLNVLSFEDLYEHITIMGDNDLYDLIRMDVAWMSELASSTYKPLTDIDKDFAPIFSNLIDNSKSDYSTVGNIKYAIPFDPSVLIFLYRKDLFEDATIKRSYYEMFHETLTIPQNFQQYNRIASFFTKSLNAESPIQYGSTLSFGTTAVAACDFLPRLLCIKDIFFDDSGRVVIDTPETLEALDNYVETYKYTSKNNNLWWRDSIKEFSTGSTAMTIAFSNHASDVINSKYSEVVGNVGFATIPGNKPVLGGGVIGISKNSKKVDACYEFFKWFYSSEISSAFTILGGLSPHKDIYNNCDIGDLFPWISESKSNFLTGSRKISNEFHPYFDQKKFENILGTAVRSAVIGTHTPKEALEYAQKLYDYHFPLQV